MLHSIRCVQDHEGTSPVVRFTLLTLLEWKPPPMMPSQPSGIAPTPAGHLERLITQKRLVLRQPGGDDKARRRARQQLVLAGWTRGIAIRYMARRCIVALRTGVFTYTTNDPVKLHATTLTEIISVVLGGEPVSILLHRQDPPAARIIPAIREYAGRAVSQIELRPTAFAVELVPTGHTGRQPHPAWRRQSWEAQNQPPARLSS